MLARRSIQKLLNESGRFLTTPQVGSLVERLNANNRDALEAEWELVILAALASMGAVEHETALGGSTRLDVRFHSPTLGSFIADIRTVSDETYDRENPIEEFSSALSRIMEGLRKEGIKGGFNYRVNGVSASVRKGQYKTKLTLPFSQEFKRVIFNSEFSAFLEGIRAEPNRNRRFEVNNQEASVSITFSPQVDGFQTGSYLSYNGAHDVEHNVVWKALKDKSRQIKRAGLRAAGELAGVILCDSDCGLLRARRGPYTVSVDDVINRFLRRSSTVDFVCVIDIAESRAYGHTPPPRIETRVWSMREKPWAQTLSASLNVALQRLSPPQDSPCNTLNHFKWAGNKQHLGAGINGTPP